jgi:hypothetical protein
MTWQSLAIFTVQGIKRWNIAVTAAGPEAYLPSWQVAAHMLGISGEHLPKTWADAFAQHPPVLDTCSRGRARGTSPLPALPRLLGANGGRISITIPEGEPHDPLTNAKGPGATWSHPGPSCRWDVRRRSPARRSAPCSAG